MEQFETYYNAALRFLSFRSRSEKEVRDHLKKKVDSAKQNVEEVEKVIEEVITKLKEQKFLNDLEFAKQWIESRMRFKPKSAKFLTFELKQKGIRQEILDMVMSDAELISSDLMRAKKLVEQKIEKYKGFPKQEIFQKLGGFLARRGFSYDIIKTSIDDILLKEV